MKYIFAVRKGGAIAQSVEQWTENPCVPGSIPGGTTKRSSCLMGSYLFMHYQCYIIYSKSVNRYYIGYTCDIEERIKLHNNGFFGSKSYSSKASDWELFLLIPCETIEEAIYLESRIKRMKSRKYIENLRKYPEMIIKMRESYH